MKRIVMVVPDPPDWEGKGYQRRAAEIVRALDGAGDLSIVWFERPKRAQMLRRALTAVLRSPGLPFQVAWTRARWPRGFPGQLSEHDLVIFVSARAVPDNWTSPAVVDFVDCLSLSAERRAQRSRGSLGALWRREAVRMRAWERRILDTALVSVAVAEEDARRLGPHTAVIPLSLPDLLTPEFEESSGRIVFSGNLQYRPNAEAAEWICCELAPALTEVSQDPKLLVIAGRNPSRKLIAQASRAGVELRANVPSVLGVLNEAAIAIAPMASGAGMQSKVLDAVSQHVPVIMSPRAANGLPMTDGEDCMICPLDPLRFAEAIGSLLSDGDLRDRLVRRALLSTADLVPDAVDTQWRSLLAHLWSGAELSQ